MIVDDIFAMQQKYEKKYGKVVILQQIGSFMECYSIDNEEEKIGSVPAIAELLNIQATRKNKSNPANDRSNPMLCGFPVASLKRCLGVLVSSQYTCVVVEQTTPPPNPKREITGVYSPGTYSDITEAYEANHLMSFVLRKESRLHGPDILRMGCATMDVSTGACTAYEAVDHELDKSFAINEGVRMIKSFNPREVIMYGENSQDLQNQLELGNRMVHSLSTCKGSEKISFMNQFLVDLYPDRGCLSPIEHIDLENKFLACLAFVNLVRFIHDHNENSLRDLQKPVILNEINTLCLENNAIQQLNVLPMNNNRATPNNVHSLMDVVGFCKTPMGARRLRDRLCRPLTNPADIEARLQKVDAYLSDKAYKSIGDHLKSIGDLERLIRKLTTNKTPACLDLDKLWTGLEACDACFDALQVMPAGLAKDDERVMTQGCLDDLMKTLDRKNLDSGAETCIFLEGHDATLDEIYVKIRECRRILESYRKILNDCVDQTSDTNVKLEYTDKDGCFMTMTKKRAEIMKKNLGTKSIEGEELDVKTVSVVNTTSVAKITTPRFKATSDELLECLETAKARTAELVRKFCAGFVKDHALNIKKICETVIETDLTSCAAEAADKRRFCRPEICDDDSDSFVIVKDLRHAIIEALHTGIQYVPTSLALGTSLAVDDEFAEMKGMNGMLLYGCNSAGKSSLMKAMGLSVILAQAGFYVPASEFRLRPFTNLMTRILGNDDLFKGHSSFATEMTELCGILKRANERTLVLGDEIANSTESTSGLAIVAASVDRLSRQRSKFIFATHLHELAKLPCINGLDDVKHFHLEIRYDATLDALVYDRRLRSGSGNAVYGLEIARAMGMDDEFLETAHKIRRELLQKDLEVVSTKTSRYNAKLNIGPCQVCMMPGEHTHHIREQHEADEDGMIGAMHKNDLSNLVILCESCHDKVHLTRDLDIRGYVQTTSGRKLDYELKDDGTPKGSCVNVFSKYAMPTVRQKARSRT